uniref:KN homeodomain domain-containing protein n=1 Tax=Anser cygnoides TaxID=8845 RepID=A0A8B9ECA3_ANSCY
MNTIVFSKLSGQVLFEEDAKERERGGRPYVGVVEGPHHAEVLLPDSPSIKESLSLRNRRTGARQSGGKVRHKRQALQDMARPLKQWLYKHRDNPYPTKTEKILLALGSQMTLVQVREPPRAAPTAPRTGGMGNAAPPRRARVWCPLSFHLPGAAGDTSASATCVGRSWEAAVRPGGPGASSPCSPQGSPPRAPSGISHG